MRLKIKVKVLNEKCMPEINPKGDWIDLKAAKNIKLRTPKVTNSKKETNSEGVEIEKHGNRTTLYDHSLIPLGVCMELPKGFEAVVNPRSSTFKNYGVISTNHQGVIDWVYKGNNDQWMFPALALKKSIINEGERVCQFKIQLSQKATMWQKLKWLLSSGVELIRVDNLDSTNRGGFGTSGK